MRCFSQADAPLAALAAALIALTAGAGRGLAQQSPANVSNSNQRTAQQPQRSATDLLDDFIFFVEVANPEMAKANAQALLDSGITPEQFVNLIDDSVKFSEAWDRAYRRALVIPELEDVTAQLEALYEGGRRARARNPEEIRDNIEMLTGTARQRILAWDRLKEAGEYAMPFLFEHFAVGHDLFLQAQVRDLMISMGRDAVGPLVAALPRAQPAVQERIAEVLGQIRYEEAVPPLADLAKSTKNANVRQAVDRAITQIHGGPVADPADAYTKLAERYFDDRRADSGSLVSFPGESHQLVWEMDPQGHLLQQAVRTEVFHETMAMLNAEKALGLNPSSQEALAVWLASNFARALDTPEGWSHPIYGDDKRDPTFYVVAAGSGPSQRALQLALDEHDTLLARLLIGAIGKTAGGVGLWTGVDDTKPLAGALSYADRRVRYEAAIALGSANPAELFPGAERVVPTLSAAVRDASARYALIIATDLERQQELRSVLEGEGYTVLPPETDLQSAGPDIASAPGIDLVVIDEEPMLVGGTVTGVRNEPKLAAAPILLFMSLKDRETYGARFRDDPLIDLARPSITDEELVNAANAVVERTSGAPVGDEEGKDYARRALRVLRDLAIANRGAFNAADAAGSLVASLTETDGDVQVMVAEVVAAICESRAQVALLDAALNASEPEQQIALLNQVVESAHRCGNMVEQRQIERLRSLVASDDVDVATGAAAAAGALNLPSDQVVPMLLKK